MNIGEKKKFLSPKVGIYTCKEIIENPDIDIDFDVKVGKCKKCGDVLTKKFKYQLNKVYILENDETKEIAYKGESILPNGEKTFVRMPEPSFISDKIEEINNKILLKSKILKEK